jgi:hypothetical protein
VKGKQQSRKFTFEVEGLLAVNRLTEMFRLTGLPIIRTETDKMAATHISGLIGNGVLHVMCSLWLITHVAKAKMGLGSMGDNLMTGS